MALWLTEEQARYVVEYAASSRPHEVCGLIAGNGNRAQKVIPIANVASDPVHYFELDQQAFIKAVFDMDTAGLSLIGIFHSHPQGLAVPSPVDIRQAAYPDVVYLIVGFHQGKPTMNAWRIQHQNVDSVQLKITTRSFEFATQDDESGLSRAQQVAIIISAILAVIVMLTLSFTLLPPPPSLPIR